MNTYDTADFAKERLEAARGQRDEKLRKEMVHN
jgi:hypothetical protein